MYKSINFTPIVSLKSLESVVISFHFSIFEPLETADSLLFVDNQCFMCCFRIEKETVFKE